MAYHPSGRELITGSWDGTVRRWGLDVLFRPPALLVSEMERDWGMGLPEALAAPVR